MFLKYVGMVGSYLTSVLFASMASAQLIKHRDDFIHEEVMRECGVALRHAAALKLDNLDLSKSANVRYYEPSFYHPSKQQSGKSLIMRGNNIGIYLCSIAQAPHVEFTAQRSLVMDGIVVGYNVSFSAPFVSMQGVINARDEVYINCKECDLSLLKRAGTATWYLNGNVWK